MNDDRHRGDDTGERERPRRLEQRTEVDLSPEMDEEQRDGKSLADSHELLRNPPRLTEQRDHCADGKPGDQDRGAEPACDPRAGEQGQQ